MDPLQPHVEPCTIGFRKRALFGKLAVHAATVLLSAGVLAWISPETSYYSRVVHEWRPLGEAGYLVVMGCASLLLAIGLLGIGRFITLAYRRHGIAITEQGLVDNSRVRRRVTEWPLIASVTPCSLGYTERGFSPRAMKGVELQIYPLMPDGSKGLPYSQKISCGLLDVDHDQVVALIQQAKASHDALQAQLGIASLGAGQIPPTGTWPSKR